ncbi:MAG: CHAP domain-containing protein [bacterium]|nr:CHAP domain-containing protein [bacterium]
MSISSVSSLNYSSFNAVSTENSYADFGSSVDINELTADFVEFSEGSGAANAAADKPAAQNINELYNRKSQAQGELGELKNKVDDNQTKLNDRREELSKANQDENGSKGTDENYEAAKKELEAAKTAKTAAQNELTRASQEGTANDQAISANNQAKASNAASLSAAQAELASLTPPAAAKEGEDNSAAVSAYQQKKAAIEAKISQLNAEKAKLESESQQLQAKKSQIEQTKAAKQSEVSQQDAAMQAAQQKMDAAKNKEAENNPKFKEALQNDEQTKTVQNELAESKQAVSGKEKEIQQLEDQIAKLEASNNDYAKTAPNVSNMLGQMGDMVGLSENNPEEAAKINDVTNRSGIDCQTTPWCAAYAMNKLDENGVLDTSSCPNVNYCPTIENWGKDQNIWEKQGNGYTPRPGDGVLFDWEQDGVSDHIGVIEKVADGKIYTIEGNSGDAVSRREYDLNSEEVRGYLNCSKQQAQGAQDNAPLSIYGEAKEAAGLTVAVAEGDAMEVAGEENTAGETVAAEEAGTAGEAEAANGLVDYNGQLVPPQVKEMFDHLDSLEGLNAANWEDAQTINGILGKNWESIDCQTNDWCCAFATAILQEHGVYDTSDLSWTNHIRCGEMMHEAQKDGCLELSQAHGGDYTPHSGDAIFFSWDKKAWEGQRADGSYYEDHIGIVEKVENGKIYTIEGNSGNAVSRKEYAIDDPRITGFINTGKQNGFNYGDGAQAAEISGEEAAAVQSGSSAESVTDPRAAEFDEKVNQMLKEWGSMEGWSEDDPVQGALINEIIQRTGLNCADDENGAWCCAFFTSMAEKYGVYDTSDSSWETLVGCGYLMQKAQGEGTLRPSQAHLEEGQEPYTPQAGDAIFIDWDGEAWDGGTEEDHVGVVVKVEDGVVYTLEGNADDHVMAREYPIDDPRITGYIDVRAQS